MNTNSSHDERKEDRNAIPPATSRTVRPSQRSSPFEIPPALKRIFDKFPLLTYPSNPLPRRAPRNRQNHVLYTFTTPADAACNRPSFNPSCLKWQTYLHITGIPFTTAPSTNHASPSGALPFLIPANASPNTAPLTSSTIPGWVRSTNKSTSSNSKPTSAPQTTGPTETIYTTLLSTPIRLAYLYALYLHPPSFNATARPLYIDSASNSAFVRFGLTSPLRQAALDELSHHLRTSAGGSIDVERLFKDAEEAFEALGTLLGKHTWFEEAVRARDRGGDGGGGDEYKDGKERLAEDKPAKGTAGTGKSNSQDEFAAQGGHQRDSSMGLFEDNADENDNDHDDEKPSEKRQQAGTGADGAGMLDAAVFSYTYVILSLFSSIAVASKQEAWSPAVRLVEAVRGQSNLVEHRDRIVERHYS